MTRRRSGPLMAGCGALLLFAAALIPAPDAGADTIREVPASHSALTDALVGELAALSAFAAKDGLGRIDPAENAAARREKRQARAIIRALNREDIDAAHSVHGAQEEAADQLLASPGAKFDLAALERLEVGDKSEEWRCLAEAMYFEARGEGLDGQVAVAEVILNRVDSEQYPDSVCGVVGQGADSGGACQFSYNCDGQKNRIANAPVYERIGKLAWLMLEGRPRTLTDEALFFHSTAVQPGWSRKYVRTAKIGRHLFYRPAVRLSRN